MSDIKYSFFVSVIVPVRNEEKFIGRCLESLVKQDYPKELYEVIVVDGNSKDKTRQIIKTFVDKLNLKILDNPKLFAPSGLNIGIKNSKGDIIIRVDGHTQVAPDFIKKSVETLISFSVDCVGGLIEAEAEGFWGEKIALALSCPFCVADARFRYAKNSQFVDTVAFGAFKKEIFEKLGLFDERLIRNQDIEFSSRIKKNGGKIFLNPEIKIKYFCRSNLWALGKQCFLNGFWNIKTIKLVPGALRIRHFIPMLFSLFIIASFVISLFFVKFLYLLLSLVLVYFFIGFLFSIPLSKKKMINLLVLPFIFFWFHFTYGIGSIFGILNFLKREVK